MSNKAAKLSLPNGETLELNVLSPTLGKDVIDVRALGKAGYFTYDPGYVSTGACESKITFIDGGKGQLLYRGYPIEQLADEATFEEVAYLLLNGELPSQAEYDAFVAKINNHTMVHQQMMNFFNGFRRDAHPMAIMIAVVGALSAFYHDSLDINDPQHREISAMRLIAKVPTIAAMCYRYTHGHPFVYPNNDKSLAWNFLNMMFSMPTMDWEPDPILVDAMDKIFTLHADHEQNASTSTVRLAGSSGANPFAAIASGIACLWGPAHGGANEACLNMLREIGDVSRIPEFIARAKDK